MFMRLHPRLALALVFVLMLSALTVPVAATDPGPVPPSVGADVPATYFGPPPSEVKKELFGPVKLLRAGQIDMIAGTITLPLYLGKMKDGRNVWYILTDTDDQGNADQLGLNWAPKLTYAAVDGGTRTGHLQNDTTLVFDKGAVDFSPARAVVPGDAPNPFPPKTANVPILMLSVHSDTLDKVRALDLGADDYLTKPFDHLELLARMRALVRRTNGSPIPSHSSIVLGGVSINFATREVRVGNDAVHLTSTEFRLLAVLAQHAGTVLPHQFLLTHVWGAEYVHDVHYLKVFVGRLRQKLGGVPENVPYIQTEWGIGYRFVSR